MVEVPLTMASSRTTAFDKISHFLHAAILDTLPCYDRLHRPDGGHRVSRFSWSATPNVSSLFGAKGQAAVQAFGLTPIMCHSTTPVTVFACDTEDASTAYTFTYATEMEGLGHLTVGLTSQQVSL